VALIGANGAGKSSILRAITGLRPIHSGAIYYENGRLDGKTPEQIVGTGISMVPEGRRVFPHMSVRDNLLMGAFMRSGKAEIARDMEKTVEKFPRLKERFRQSAGTMSGGEQQMLVIGRALMARPKVLLLDEPSLGIAPKLVQSIARSIVQINREDKVSVLLVEQNARMALKISHRAYALSVGEVAIGGNSADLQNDDRIRKLYLGME
ncbi:MAG: ABC transporter ATP-binding protein, partial [Betaproteobacteria bacterium]|nr:ABC transporter ATP-binding protein [Betaproteobacteria bacterium]